MNSLKSNLILALRLGLGVIFVYSGITKVFDPSWSAAGFLMSAKTIPGFFHWLAQPGIVTVVSIINAWAQLLLGISLLLGLGIRISAIPGAVLMFLYYLVVLNFPYVGSQYFLVDNHIIFIICLLFLYATNAGTIFGLDAYIKIKKA